MNLRTSLILLIVGSWVAVGAAFIVDSGFGNETREPEPPFFYNIPVDDIVHINLETGDSEVGFHYRENVNRWFFDDTEEYVEVPADLFRFGGITTLLGGPRTQAFLSDTIEDAAQYGLDDPSSRYTISLRDGTERVLLVGNQTPDGSSTYAQIEGLPQLVIVDSSWSQVLNRLVNEPPVPEWMYTLNTDEVREVLLYVNNEIVGAYGIDRPTGTYRVCELPIQDDPCAGTEPVDEEAFSAAMNHIADRHIDGAVALNINTEEGFQEYGADRFSPYFAIRIERPSQSQPGVTDVNRVSMTIGDVTPDGEHRYAVVNETSDVILVDREWADEALKIFEPRALASDAE